MFLKSFCIISYIVFYWSAGRVGAFAAEPPGGSRFVVGRLRYKHRVQVYVSWSLDPDLSSSEFSPDFRCSAFGVGDRIFVMLPYLP